MGHLLLIALHLAALLAAPAFLFVTLPAHILYSLLSGGQSPDKPRPSTHVKCPDCKEFVLKEASVCKHCGCRLVPVDSAAWKARL